MKYTFTKSVVVGPNQTAVKGEVIDLDDRTASHLIQLKAITPYIEQESVQVLNREREQKVKKRGNRN